MPPSKKETTESRLHTISGGEEPTFTANTALQEMDLYRHLNWYNQHRDTSHAQKYLSTFCAKHNIPFTEAQIRSRANTLGYVCRMISRGAILSPEAAAWLQESIQKMEQSAAVLPALNRIKGDTSDRPKTVKVKPVANTSANAIVSACISALDAAIDEFILSDCKHNKPTLTIIQKHELERGQLPAIINVFKRMRDEYQLALDGKDAILTEGYSNFTTPQLKKLVAYTDQIMSDTLVTMGSGTSTKVLRKKKVKTPEQLTKKLKYHTMPKQYGETTYTSIDPKKIIGMSALFVFNTKTRMLSCYIAETEEGLSVKGSTILNYSTTRSTGKTLRKPEVQLPQLLTGGKIVAKHFLSTINAKGKSLNGRINKDCLLLKSF